jgi:hypothetical protein
MCCTMTHHRDVRVQNHYRCVCVVIAYHSHARIRQGIRFCASTASCFPFFHLYPSLDSSFTSLRHPQTLYRVQLRALRDAHLRIRRVRRPTRPLSPAATILWERFSTDCDRHAYIDRGLAYRVFCNGDFGMRCLYRGHLLPFRLPPQFAIDLCGPEDADS